MSDSQKNQSVQRNQVGNQKEVRRGYQDDENQESYTPKKSFEEETDEEEKSSGKPESQELGKFLYQQRFPSGFKNSNNRSI